MPLSATTESMMVDCLEVLQEDYERSRNVLYHFKYELNGKRTGARMVDGSWREVRVMLLAGGDLIESFGTPGLWLNEDVWILFDDI